MKSRFLLFVCFLVFLGCEEEKKFEPIYLVPDNIEPYIATFLKEASARGHNLTIDNLIVRYDDTMDAAICGKCNDATNAKIQKIISIKSGFPCWMNKQELETLLFHEIGHCVLHRDHLTDKLPNGDPKSIMVPGNSSLYSPCVYDVDAGNCDRSYKRAYYMDELFDVNTPVPDWAK